MRVFAALDSLLISLCPPLLPLALRCVGRVCHPHWPGGRRAADAARARAAARQAHSHQCAAVACRSGRRRRRRRLGTSIAATTVRAGHCLEHRQDLIRADFRAHLGTIGRVIMSDKMDINTLQDISISFLSGGITINQFCAIERLCSLVGAVALCHLLGLKVRPQVAQRRLVAEKTECVGGEGAKHGRAETLEEGAGALAAQRLRGAVKDAAVLALCAWMRVFCGWDTMGWGGQMRRHGGPIQITNEIACAPARTDESLCMRVLMSSSG
jgi:hypothetical protein